MNKLTKILGIILILFALPNSCKTTQETVSQNKTQNAPKYNFANIYNPSSTTLHPKFIVYNLNDTQCVVYNYIYLPELLFINKNGVAEAKIELSYKVTPSLNNYQVLDSLDKTLVIRQQKYRKSLIFPQKLPVSIDSSFLLTIYAKDIYKRRNFLSLKYVDKEDKYSPNNFMIKYSDLKPVFSNYIYEKNSYLVQYNQNTDTLFVYRYESDSITPLPPYYLTSRINKLYADTVFAVRTDTFFTPDTTGIYLFTPDSLVEKGKTVTVFNSDYPLIVKASEMIGPLAYIATQEEYKKMLKNESPKLAVDNFWLDIAESPSRAKELIKIYYNRVQLANIYFNDYREGWRTDRGMLYIILGPPPIVYKSDKTEEWLYYNRQSNSYVSFKFKKTRISPLKNVYVLQPSITYKYFWQNAISQWRKGIVPGS